MKTLIKRSHTRWARPKRTSATPAHGAARSSVAAPEPARPNVDAMRSGPSRTVVLLGSGLGLVALLIAAAVAAVIITAPSLERAGGSRLTSDSTPQIRLHLEHGMNAAAGDIDVRVSGRDVTSPSAPTLTRSGAIAIQLPKLRDGEHLVRVRVHQAGVLRRTVEASWLLTVDTKAPALRVVSPIAAKAGNAEDPYVPAGVVSVKRSKLAVTLGAEADSVATITSSAPTAEPVHAEGVAGTRRTIQVPLPDGAQTLTIEARDRAGNMTSRTMRVLVDTAGPIVTATVPRIVTDSKLAIPVSARDAYGVTLEVTLDGKVVDGAYDIAASTPAPNSPVSDKVVDGATIAAAVTDATNIACDADEGCDAALEGPAPIAVRGSINLDEGVYEGRHTLELVAIDSLGTITRSKHVFVVDSTEKLAEAVGMKGGARGQDVAELQKALLENDAATRAQLLPDIRSKAFGAATRAAVIRYQNQQGMAADGVVGADTLAGLTLRIVIDRTQNTLTLFRNGAIVKAWGVATGQPAYPTPTGDFKIQTMEKNPTWTPPDSEWAKDAKVIPPGPNNPLGTRWMAIDGTVGIHGTNNAASIGYSQSHGCIRMRIPDVEELFGIVAIGTRVSVV